MLTEEEKEELERLREKDRLCSLGDRPQSPSAKMLRRLMELEKKEMLGREYEEWGVHLCPPSTTEEFPMDGWISSGFGAAYVTKDGQTILDSANPEMVDIYGRDAESLASQDPDHVWEIVILRPLSSMTFRRQGDGKWICVEKGEGFA